MQIQSRSTLILSILLMGWLLHSCDESESTLGGLPGGQAISLVDSVEVRQLATFHRQQDLVGAARQAVGRSDSLGLESVLLFRLDYQPVADWDPAPQQDPFSVWLSFKMDHDPDLAWFPQTTVEPVGPGESANYMDLDLFLLSDSLSYEDLGWDNVFDAGDLALGVLDHVQFRVSDADTAYGDNENPLTGRKTWRELPRWWFQHADTSARWLMLRAQPGQQGFMSVLAAGYAAELRPRIRFSSVHVDTVLIGDSLAVDFIPDTTYINATWQSSVIRDQSAPNRMTLSTGWAGQVIAELPPFPPNPEDPRFDPLSASLVEAWLKVPLGDVGFNRVGAKVNLYAVGQYDSLGLNVNADQLIAYELIEDSMSVMSFNITPYIRRVWVQDVDSLRNTDPIALALKLDDFNQLQLRQVGLAGAAPGLRPRLVYSLSEAPAGWRRP